MLSAVLCILLSFTANGLNNGVAITPPMVFVILLFLNTYTALTMHCIEYDKRDGIVYSINIQYNDHVFQ